MEKETFKASSTETEKNDDVEDIEWDELEDEALGDMAGGFSPNIGCVRPPE